MSAQTMVKGPKLTEEAVARIMAVYVPVYAACAGFGMAEAACRRYARDAVEDSHHFVSEIRKGETE